MRTSSRRRLPQRRRPIARKIRRPVRPVVPATDPRLQEGIALFNHHQFFECHEVLEQRWRELADSSKDFYKGLIQAAVAFHHWSRGNLPGALTLARSSATYLKRYEPVYAGVEVARFLTPFTELFQWLRRHSQRYDSRLVPVIRLRA